jgi:hypothetical protein
MGLLQHRMNEHAHDCEVAYGLLEHSPLDDDAVAAFEVQVGDLDREELVAEGKVLAAALRAGGEPPSLDELRWWHRRTRVCIKALKETDPEAVASYMSDLESEQDRWLIRGM